MSANTTYFWQTDRSKIISKYCFEYIGFSNFYISYNNKCQGFLDRVASNKSRLT